MIELNVESRQQPTASYIEGVPILSQRYRNWCGYTSLSMVLQYWGHSELTPERIFKHIHEDFEGEFGGNYYEPDVRFVPAPSIDALALAAQQLTPLRARLIRHEDYKMLKKTSSPYDVLNAYIVKKQAPMIVRVPGHFMVVRGVDIEARTYAINNPIGGERVVTARSLGTVWGRRESDYVRDTRHLMLAILPQK